VANSKAITNAIGIGGIVNNKDLKTGAANPRPNPQMGPKKIAANIIGKCIGVSI